MFGLLSGEKAHLKLTPCKTSDDSPLTPLTAEAIEILINPASLKLDDQICYAAAAPLGDTGSGKKFDRVTPSTLSFSVVFDGTGAVPPPLTSLINSTAADTLTDDVSTRLQIDDQIQKVRKVILDYEGDIHEPRVVQILWGTTLFTGRLTTISTDYTLFRPSGAPLRATVALAFEGFKSSKEAALEANKSSSDLSHMVVVRAGDSLPLLCQKIYGNTRYYLEVARFNGLSQFRNLPPGLQLHFPPLE